MSGYRQMDEPQKRSGTSCCLWGCLGMFVLCTVLCAGAATWLYFNWKSFVANAARGTMVKIIEESELDQDDQEEMVAQVDRIADGFKKGEITVEDMGKVFTELAQSPVMVLLIVYAVEEKYVDPSGLSDKEKKDAHLTLERVARGVVQDQISQADLESALDEISTVGSDGERQLKETITDDELRAFLVKAKQTADDAGIPNESYEVDVGEEFKKAVDKALGVTDEEPMFLEQPLPE